ncbi:MAG: VOC family protein [Thermoleophilaceae bacterium]
MRRPPSRRTSLSARSRSRSPTSTRSRASTSARSDWGRSSARRVGCVSGSRPAGRSSSSSRSQAPPPPRWSSGLFHLALLVPSRAELARAVRRVTGAGGRFTGASDHLVSEALYLNDPEGNGIEIYRDRPREEWEHTGGEVRMSTLALDLDAVMAELPAGDGPDGMPPGTVMGHVHLSVADLAETESFYADVLGFDVTVRSYPGALFLSAGGYHHHVGANTWTSAGVPAPALA